MSYKIIRTKTEAKGGITSAEKVKMEEHAKIWINRALRTDPIDRSKITEAIIGLYRLAGLEPPRIVIVPSPLVMAFAYGAASAIWHNRTYAATRDATDDVTRDATYAATRAATDAATRAATDAATRAATDAATRAATDAATRDATYGATRDATDDATYVATRDATRFATYAATYVATRDATDAATRVATDAATRAATRAATYVATYDATDAATRDATDAAARACFKLAGKLGLRCANNWPNSYQGGNMWAAWECYLSAFRDILGLHLRVHEKYKYWEQAAIHGGFRVMHKEFCLVSDFPEFIKIDERNRPHCSDGPSHRWRDGWELFYWHGMRVDRSVIMDCVTVERIEKEDNAEIRRILVERFGMGRYVKESGAKKIHSDDFGTLYCKDQPNDEPIYMVNVICPTTGREYMLGVDPSMYKGRAGKEAKAAVASTWRDNDTGELVFATPDAYAWDAHT